MRLEEVRRSRKMLDRLRGLYRRVRYGLNLDTDFELTMHYKPDFFGRPFVDYVRAVFREDAEWTAGERELLATIASQMQKCDFCMSAHREFAAEEMPVSIVDAALLDWRSAPISERLKAVIAFYEKMNDPAQVIGPEDMDALRVAGINEAAILQALHIRTVFMITTRVADALGFEVPPPEVWRKRRGRQ